MTSRSKNTETETAKALAALMELRGLSQAGLAKTAGVSQGYVNQVVNSEKLASAEWLNLIAEATELSREEAVKLHRAAARDHGFDIDL